jgi:hypothetical protein
MADGDSRACLPARVLVLGGEVEQTQLVRTALRAVASEVHLSSDVCEPPEGWDLVLIHYDSFPQSARAEVLRRLEGLRAAGRVLAYLSTPSRDAISPLLSESRITNFFASQGALDIEELLVTVRKMLGSDIFGIDKYFSSASRSHTMSVDRSSQKGEVLDLATAFACDVARPQRLVDQFTTTVDELVSNALFNAPVDAAGQFRFAHLSRTETVTLLQGQRVDIEFRSDGRRLGVAVADPFGTLTVEVLTRYVGQRIGVLTGSQSSAGVGLFSVLSRVSHLAVNLAPVRKTEFIALLDIRGGTYRDFVRRGTAFNLFLSPG